MLLCSQGTTFFRNLEKNLNEFVLQLFGLIASCVLYFVYKAKPTCDSENEDQITETVLSNIENHSIPQIYRIKNEVFNTGNKI